MATVTYKNQPGTASVLKQGTPLAGTSHVYKVGKVLWHEEVEEFLQTLFIPKTLHVCCGKSKLGDFRVDLHEEDVDLQADAAKLPLDDESWETVLCDPPYNGKFQWNHDMLNELARVASKRIIFQHWFIPCNPQGKYKKWQDRWELSAAYIWQPRTYFGRVQVISVLDRCDL